MPYVICSDCELLTYSAELWASTEHCPRCGAQQPTAERSAFVERDGDLPGNTWSDVSSWGP
jgi:hypothetical protein